MHKKEVLKPQEYGTDNAKLPLTYYELWSPNLQALMWEPRLLFDILSLFNYLLLRDH